MYHISSPLVEEPLTNPIHVAVVNKGGHHGERSDVHSRVVSRCDWSKGQRSKVDQHNFDYQTYAKSCEGHDIHNQVPVK